MYIDINLYFSLHFRPGYSEPGIIAIRCKIFYRYSMVKVQNFRNWHAFVAEIRYQILCPAVQICSSCFRHHHTIAYFIQRLSPTCLGSSYKSK